MQWSESDKGRALQAVWDARRELNTAAMQLNFMGKTAEANKLRTQAKRLTVEGDRIVAQLLAEWTERAEKLLPEIAAAGARLQFSLDRVQDGNEVATNVANVIGQVEKFVGVVARIAAI